MYRGPSRNPFIGTIYPTLLEFGGIDHIILSYKDAFLEFKEPNCYTDLSRTS